MLSLARLAAVAVALCGPGALGASELPTFRVATLSYGTVAWELETIRAAGFDRANGFRLEVQAYAGDAAARIAFQAGEADAVVADWLWAARLRGEGRDLRTLPYSRAVGALLVPGNSPRTSLADLAGARVGIAGGPLDKSWLILRAHAAAAEGIDLMTATTQVYAAPPLVNQQALSGQIDAVITYWNHAAKLEAAGFRPVETVAAAAEALGLGREVPLLAYVLDGALVAREPALARGFAAASRAAKDLLARDDSAWERLRSLMKAASDAEFVALRAGFRAGIPAPGPIDRIAAAALFALMAEIGGPELTGAGGRLPEGLFLDPDG